MAEGGTPREETAMEVDADQHETSCKSCKMLFTQQQVSIILDWEMNDLVHDKSKKKLGEFYRKMNSLVNSRGGILVIHAKDPRQLGKFDEKVDDTLCGQITTGVMYQQVFHRYFYDKLHIVYVVTAASGKRPFGALEVNSKISLSKGKESLTYTQTAVLLEELQTKNARTPQMESQEFLFDEGKEVLITTKPPDRDEVTVPFHESSFVQAKEVIENKKTKFTTAELVSFCWKHLPEYISAFTKNENGGSVFFGVSEEKVRGKAVKFNASSVHLPDKEIFCQSIIDKVRNEMMWVGASEPLRPVEVHLRKVNNAPEDNCIIEVKINYYHGICFYERNGPEAYRLPGPNPVDHKRIDAIGWIQSFEREKCHKEDCENCPKKDNEACKIKVWFEK